MSATSTHLKDRGDYFETKKMTSAAPFQGHVYHESEKVVKKKVTTKKIVKSADKVDVTNTNLNRIHPWYTLPLNQKSNKKHPSKTSNTKDDWVILPTPTHYRATFNHTDSLNATKVLERHLNKKHYGTKQTMSLHEKQLAQYKKRYNKAHAKAEKKIKKRYD